MVVAFSIKNPIKLGFDSFWERCMVLRIQIQDLGRAQIRQRDLHVSNDHKTLWNKSRISAPFYWLVPCACGLLVEGDMGFSDYGG